MSDKSVVTLTLGIALAILAAIVIPVYVVGANGTSRHNACVTAGGSYVRIPDTGYFECQNGSN